MHHWVPDSTEAFVVSVESGIDMHMQGDKYFEAVVAAVKSGRIPESRIDQAAGKILAVKFALGLFEQPVPEIPEVLEGAAEHRQTALEAARQEHFVDNGPGKVRCVRPVDRFELLHAVRKRLFDRTTIMSGAQSSPGEILDVHQSRPPFSSRASSHAMFRPRVCIVAMPSSSASTSPGVSPTPMFQ